MKEGLLVNLYVYMLFHVLPQRHKCTIVWQLFWIINARCACAQGFCSQSVSVCVCVLITTLAPAYDVCATN